MTKRDPVGFLKNEYQELVDKDLDWKHRILESASDPICVVEGKEVIMLCSNNYLNLSNHPYVVQKAKEAIEKYGAGSGSVRAIAGNKRIPKINVELDESILKELPPVMRLKLLESLLIHMRGGKVSFTDVKTEEKLKPLLFGTAIKYNDRVQTVVQRFKYLYT